MRHFYKNFYKGVVSCFLLCLVLSGCSQNADDGKDDKTVASEEQKDAKEGSQKEASGENSTKEGSNIDTQEGENRAAKLNKGMNANTFVCIDELEQLAEQYKEENSDITDSAAMLVAKYLRSANSNYNTTNWNMLAGTPDENFSTYVSEHGSEDVASFRENATIVDPATQTDIEFSHLIASVNLALRQQGMSEETQDVQQSYVDYGSWCGDLLQLCAQMKQEGVDSSQWKEQMEGLIGDEDSYFNRDDLYADLDACNMSELLDDDTSLAQVFYDYYYSVLEKTQTTRYEYFCEKHFDGAQDAQTLAQKMSSLMQDENAMVMQVLISAEGLDASTDASLIATSCEALADKVVQGDLQD